MMTGKERAALRARANGLDTIVHIGKEGIGENLISQVDGALTTRELIKLCVLETAPLSPREACMELAQKTGAEQVQVIGRRFVLFRENPELHRPKPVLTKPAAPKVRTYQKPGKGPYKSSYPKATKPAASPARRSDSPARSGGRDDRMEERAGHSTRTSGFRGTKRPSTSSGYQKAAKAVRRGKRGDRP